LQEISAIRACLFSTTSGRSFHDPQRLCACLLQSQYFHPVADKVSYRVDWGSDTLRGLTFSNKGEIMIETNATPPPSSKEKGGIGYVLLWMMGVPIPLLILFALLKGCA
jgi:hypothetical protein